LIFTSEFILCPSNGITIDHDELLDCSLSCETMEKKVERSRGLLVLTSVGLYETRNYFCPISTNLEYDDKC